MTTVDTSRTKSAPQRLRRFKSADFVKILAGSLAISDVNAKRIFKLAGQVIRDGLIAGKSVVMRDLHNPDDELGIGDFRVIPARPASTHSLPKRIPRRLVFTTSKAFNDAFHGSTRQPIVSKSISHIDEFDRLEPPLESTSLGRPLKSADVWSVLISSWRAYLLEHKIIQIPSVGTLEFTTPARIRPEGDFKREVEFRPTQQFSLQIANHVSKDIGGTQTSDYLTKHSFGLGQERESAALMPPAATNI